MYGYPLGHVDQHDIPVTVVSSDWQGMGHAAAQALIDAGRRHIAFICGELIPGMWHSRCLDGYAIAHLHANIDLDRKLVLSFAPGIDAGSEAALAILAMHKNKRPDAVNVGTAGRFLRAMRDAGVPVPRDNLVICGDNHRIPEFGVEGRPIVSMETASIVNVALAQLRARCTQTGPVSAVIFAPFACANMPAPAYNSRAHERDNPQ